MKKKILIIHPALAPYRIDYFNKLNQIFNLKIIFLNNYCVGHNFKNDLLFSKVNFQYKFYTQGFKLFNRDIRFGLTKAVKIENPDVLVVQEFSIQTIYFLLLRFFKILKIKNITILTDDNKFMVKNPQPKIKFYLKSFLTKLIDNLIVLSNEVKKEYINLGVNENCIIVQPLIQDEKRFIIELNNSLSISNSYLIKYNLENKKILLFVGRFSEEKGIINLLYAFEKFLNNKNKKDYILILVGNGAQEKEIKIIISKLNIESNVLIPGRFEGIDLIAWYNLAALFILPSSFEPFGAVVNEALLSGVPVLLNNKVGAASLISSEEQGKIIDCSDFNSFINQIDHKLLNHSKEIQVRKSLMRLNFDESFKDWDKLK